MKRILYFILLSGGTFSSTFAQTEAPRFSCAEVRTLGFQALQQLLQVYVILVRDREVCVAAAGPQLGSTDRGYYHQEVMALNAELHRIVENSSFKDSYGEIYSYFKDGLTFQSLVESPLGGNFPTTFLMKPVNLSAIDEMNLITVESALASSLRAQNTLDEIREHAATVALALNACPL